MISDSVRVYRRLVPYIRAYWTWLVGGAVLAALASAMNGTVVWLVKPVMDGIFVRHDTELSSWCPSPSWPPRR